MQVVGTQVIPANGGKAGFSVEFVGDGGEIVSVQMKNDAVRSLNRRNAVDKAKELMGQFASANVSEGDRQPQGHAKRALIGRYEYARRTARPGA
jgi:hypothetical protein